MFRKKYAGRKTVIQNKKKKPELVMIDTMGAFGKTPIYNRLKGWKFVGYTKGYTHYHFSANGLYEKIVEVVENSPYSDILHSYKYGQGANWKMRVVKKGLEILGLPSRKLLNIGFSRGYYIYPLAANWKEFLRMETDSIKPFDLPFSDLVNHWWERWLSKRL